MNPDQPAAAATPIAINGVVVDIAGHATPQAAAAAISRANRAMPSSWIVMKKTNVLCWSKNCLNVSGFIASIVACGKFAAT